MAGVLATGERRPSVLVQRIIELMGGRLLNGGSVTLTASVTSTTITRQGVGKGDVVILSPQTANAAGALATTYAVATAKNTIVVTHSSAVSVDRTFGYLFFAGTPT